MKKVLLWGALVAMVLPLGLSVAADEFYQQEDIMKITKDAGEEVDEFFRPKADILMDAKTGQILYGDNVDAIRDPGSMAKLMSVYVVLQAIKEGKLSYDTEIKATAADLEIANNPLVSNSPIVEGHSYKVRDLLKMTLIPSSSAATIMLANKISGNDPDAWLDAMNAWAKKIGMSKSQWNNPSGATTATFEGVYSPKRYDNGAFNETTPRDMATLGYHIVNEFPELLEITKNFRLTILQGTDEEQEIENYNYSLPGGRHPLKGADGLKTGSSPRADYNYMVTVERNGQRFVQVTMGVGSYDVEAAEEIRHIIGNALAEKMFATYEYKRLLKKGEQEIDGKTYVLPADFYAVAKKGTKPKLVVKNGYLQADNGLKPLNSQVRVGMKVKEKAGAAEGAVSSSKGADWHLVFALLPLLILRYVFKQDKKKYGYPKLF